MPPTEDETDSMDTHGISTLLVLTKKKQKQRLKADKKSLSKVNFSFSKDIIFDKAKQLLSSNTVTH